MIKGLILVQPAVTMLVKEIRGGQVLCEFICADDPPAQHWIKPGESWRGDLLIKVEP